MPQSSYDVAWRRRIGYGFQQAMHNCPDCQAPLEAGIPFCVFCGALLPAEENPLLGQTIDGRYRLDALLGQGGMGDVFRATDLQTENAVALKLLLNEWSDNAIVRERFRREATALASLDHPHLIKILAQGDWSDGDISRPYFVMPYVPGPTLLARVEDGPLPARDAVTIVTHILEAIESIHAHGWVHRDIKAANIILRQADGAPILLDMGIARSTSGQSHLTQRGEVIGTPEAMAPEQILGKDVDARTDVYQVGALLLHLLMGKPAFGAQSTGSWYGVHLHDTPDVGGLRSLPMHVAQTCLKAMSKDPNHRFQSAEAMRLALLQTDTSSP